MAPCKKRAAGSEGLMCDEKRNKGEVMREFTRLLPGGMGRTMNMSWLDGDDVQVEGR